MPGADGVPEHEVQELLKFKMRYGRPYVLVRWAGLDAAGDTLEPLNNLTNCEARSPRLNRPQAVHSPGQPRHQAPAPPVRRRRSRHRVQCRRGTARLGNLQGDKWEPLNNLTNCCEATIMMITGALEQATVHLLAVPGSTLQV